MCIYSTCMCMCGGCPVLVAPCKALAAETRSPEFDSW